MNRHLVIHGHFYQPPRENPWIEAIEEQGSAAPFHDWNERINAECYFPNACARILDAAQRIVEITNNYKVINFNFGPTLLAWLEKYAPEVYESILMADRESAAHNHGHGGAIAQCYNHIIMPLANERDQRTQILWGLADFQHRFKRRPASIWLPETAISQQTLNLVTEFNLDYIILSPYQAWRVRPLRAQAEEWTIVENGDIDVRRPYRCFARDERGNRIPERYIDIFFYHGPISRAISFEHLIRNATHLGERIEQTYSADDKDQLISIATDGETYGHHERFGEMGLAYFLNYDAPSRHIQMTNYAAYLEKHPPTWEVELKPGPDGEGTAWSCAHGVGRWYRDCGCKTGGEAGWHQRWRTPLRRAVDRLRDRLAELTEAQGSGLFKNVWAARDDYIQVILDRSPERIDQFIARHAAGPLTDAERVHALKLMEIQRHAQLMYTSCGWFFTEISGIETVQILKYAARAIQLAESLPGAHSFEPAFLEDLETAESNLARYQNGKWIYQNMVKPAVITPAKVVNHFSQIIFHAQTTNHTREHDVYAYHLIESDRTLLRRKERAVLIGRVQVLSRITRESWQLAYLLVDWHPGESIFCSIRELGVDEWHYDEAKAEIQKLIDSEQEDFPERARAIWEGEIFTLADIFHDKKYELISVLAAKELPYVDKTYEEMYQRCKDTYLTLKQIGVPLPERLVMPAKYALSRLLTEEAESTRSVQGVRSFQKALDAVRMAGLLGIKLDTRRVCSIFQQRIEKNLRALARQFTFDIAVKIETLVETADRLKLGLDETPIQNLLYTVLQNRVKPAIESILLQPEDVHAYKTVNEVLRIAYRFNFNIKIYKDRLKPYEEQINQDPNYWP